MMATMMHVAHGDPAFSFGRHQPRTMEPTKRSHDHAHPVTVDTHTVEQLKQLIRRTHPKYFAFSLLDMRKVSTPPVKIPPEYRCTTATATLVGGHVVPLTRTMWIRQQRQRPHALATINEVNEDASTDRRK
jgi:hypothetical protein